MSRCEWNPVFSRNATDPPSEGDCPNDGTVCVGASGRWHLCASCAALDVFVKARLKQSPILTAEERRARRVSMGWQDIIREQLEIAKESAPLIPREFDAATTMAILRLFENILNDPSAEKVVRRALMKSGK